MKKINYGCLGINPVEINENLVAVKEKVFMHILPDNWAEYGVTYKKLHQVTTDFLEKEKGLEQLPFTTVMQMMALVVKRINEKSTARLTAYYFCGGITIPDISSQWKELDYIKSLVKQEAVAVCDLYPDVTFDHGAFIRLVCDEFKLPTLMVTLISKGLSSVMKGLG